MKSTIHPSSPGGEQGGSLRTSAEQQYSEENASKPKDVLQLDNTNREIVNDSKISFQVKIPIQE
jgi:hypothetical protein